MTTLLCRDKKEILQKTAHDMPCVHLKHPNSRPIDGLNYAKKRQKEDLKFAFQVLGVVMNLERDTHGSLAIAGNGDGGTASIHS